ncbi:MAG: hypothetical protein ACW99F_08425 [Candidatus Hodarchaeales archaeon]|jgi:DNA-binding MarR family transcriptional regulator
MFRQNAILNDFVNFLKARGRFRDIEFIDNSVHATPRIPDFPSIVFYIEETRSEPKQQSYILEIHGNESTVMNREIREFFNLHELIVQKTRVKYHLQTETHEDLSSEVEGIGSSFDSFMDQIHDLMDQNKFTIQKTRKTLIFGIQSNEKKSAPKRPSQITKKIKTKIRPETQKVSSVKKAPIPVTNPQESKATRQIAGIESNFDKEKPLTIGKNESLSNQKEEMFLTDDEKNFGEEVQEIKDEDLFREPPSNRNNTTSAKTDSDADLFKMKPPIKSYSNGVTPYLKQSSGLFRKDNWEEDLPTELEMEILDRTFARIKHRTKPEILAKDMGIAIEEAEKHLRNLISKGLLRTQVGWFIIKKSHLPFFKKNFSEGSRKKKKKKSPRISRSGEGLTSEEIATIKAIKSRPNLKAQSNLLTRPTGLKQSILKEVLRNLVDKGILRVSYGWYILKDKHILEQKRGGHPVDSSRYSSVITKTSV